MRTEQFDLNRIFACVPSQNGLLALLSLERELQRDGYCDKIRKAAHCAARSHSAHSQACAASHPRGDIVKMTNSLKRQLAILAVATLVSSAWAQQPGGAWTQSLIKTRATVTAINAATREVTIQGDQGPVTVSVSPDVKNFANLKVGDQVNISYYRGIGAQIVKGSKKVSDPAVSTFTSGNSPGMRPAGKAGASATVTVKVQDINLPTNTVAFTMSDGTTHIIEVRTPEMQQFIRELKRGDVVQVTFTDSIAVSVIPAS